MSYTLGFSPCPNDTFLFDAWVNGKISTALPITTTLADVETLNQWALEARLDITKLSFPALFRNLNTYRLLRTGAALGNGVGPLLISRAPIEDLPESIREKRIVLPGKTTTANLLFTYAYPEATQKSYLVFSEIEDAVLQGQADLGVIIHENRFTYAQRGLHLVKDLGTHWETQTGCAVPLGCIALKRSMGERLAEQVTQCIQKSLKQAWDQLPTLPNYVKDNAQEMEESVMRQHIDLYVNAHTNELSEFDIESIQTLCRVYCQVEQIKQSGPALLF
ncbi:MAG: 1,4-dihydroxy-6-naphthoate synthase [Bacteroidetes bacterium]|nr:1,4-dihydroxy-6-naphthoate synthase [Bacteroidota bacterium]